MIGVRRFVWLNHTAALREAQSMLSQLALNSDISSLRLLAVKGVLFVILGILCTGIVAAAVFGLLEWWLGLAAHFVAIWAFCRGYYFAFYVITAYADPSFRHAGLWSEGRKAWGMVRSRRVDF